MSRLSALYTYSLQYQMNKNNLFYVQYWIFDNCYLLNYPAVRNIFGVNQIIRYRYNEDPAITNNFFGTVALRFSGVPLYQNSYLAAKLRACLHGGGGPQTSEVTCGGSPHLPYKHNQIKMRDYMDRRVTPPKRITSPTWGPPPPCIDRPLGRVKQKKSSWCYVNWKT